MIKAIKKFIRGFSYALRGVGSCIYRERNMRFHCMAVMLVLYWCCFFGPTASEFAVVMLCFGLVMALECVNTAVEALSDKLTGERHPLIRIAKDTAAGAVLLAAVVSAVCGFLLFLQQPRFGVAVRRIFTSPLWGSVFAALIFGAFCFIFVLPTPEKELPALEKKEKKD